jgi:hypothetical protein
MASLHLDGVGTGRFAINHPGITFTFAPIPQPINCPREALVSS